MEMLRNALDEIKELLVSLLHWVQGWAATPYGSWALFLIAFAESSFFPIPPDVLLIPLCLANPEGAFFYAALCSLGSVLGGMTGYGIGYYGGRPLLLRLFSAQRVDAVASYYDRYNAWAVGIAGLTPLPYKVFTVSGGALAIQFRIFVAASAVSRSARFFGVAGLIYFFGEPIEAFLEKYFNLLSVAFVILLILGFWLAGHGLGRVGGRRETGGEPVPEPGPQLMGEPDPSPEQAVTASPGSQPAGDEPDHDEETRQEHA